MLIFYENIASDLNELVRNCYMLFYINIIHEIKAAVQIMIRIKIFGIVHSVLENNNHKLLDLVAKYQMLDNLNLSPLALAICFELIV